MNKLWLYLSKLFSRECPNEPSKKAKNTRFSTCGMGNHRPNGIINSEVFLQLLWPNYLAHLDSLTTKRTCARFARFIKVVIKRVLFPREAFIFAGARRRAEVRCISEYGSEHRESHFCLVCERDELKERMHFEGIRKKSMYTNISI